MFFVYSVDLPEGTVVGSPMGFALDNYDELSQSKSGTDSLYATMSIINQYIPDVESGHPDIGRGITDQASTTKAPARRKRTLGILNQKPLTPYRKVPKKTNFGYRNTTVPRLPDVMTRARRLNFLGDDFTL